MRISFYSLLISISVVAGIQLLLAFSFTSHILSGQNYQDSAAACECICNCRTVDESIAVFRKGWDDLDKEEQSAANLLGLKSYFGREGGGRGGSPENDAALQSFANAAEYIAALKDYVEGNMFSTCEKGNERQDLWRLWEEQGVHVVPVHYYSPIISSDDLEMHYNARQEASFDMKGIDMNDSFQHDILAKILTTYRSEVVAFPESLPDGIDASVSLTYFTANGMFGAGDASLYHTMIRNFRPQRIIEVGSGSSLKVSMAAASLNDRESGTTTNITVIEPFPGQAHNIHLLKAEGLSRLIDKKIQDVPVDEFHILEANDILFLDSSHVVGTGTDTTHEFTKILPRLAPGVIIHVHDIFLPNDLPYKWVVGEHRGWAEQYLLQAFLMYNSEFEVLVSSSYIRHKYLAEIKKSMPERFTVGGGSFWFRRAM